MVTTGGNEDFSKWLIHNRFRIAAEFMQERTIKFLKDIQPKEVIDE